MSSSGTARKGRFGQEYQTDERLRDILEWLLWLRDDFKEGKPPTAREAFRAVYHLRDLVLNLAEPLAEVHQLWYPPKMFRGMPPLEKRAQAIRNILAGLPLLQKDLADELCEGLEGLNGGVVEPLLSRAVGPRGSHPQRVAHFEMLILEWIRYHHGLDQKISDLEARVADAAGCSPHTLRKWRERLEKVYGRDRFRYRLELAERIGRLKVSGGESEASHDRDDLDAFNLWLTEKTFVSDLEHLIEERRRAKGKRSVPKSTS